MGTTALWLLWKEPLLPSAGKKNMYDLLRVTLIPLLKVQRPYAVVPNCSYQEMCVKIYNKTYDMTIKINTQIGL